MHFDSTNGDSQSADLIMNLRITAADLEEKAEAFFRFLFEK